MVAATTAVKFRTVQDVLHLVAIGHYHAGVGLIACDPVEIIVGELLADLSAECRLLHD